MIVKTVNVIYECLCRFLVADGERYFGREQRAHVSGVGDGDSQCL